MICAIEKLERRTLFSNPTLSWDVAVPGKANIYGAMTVSPPAPGGGGAGVSPTIISFPVSTSPRILTIEDRGGTVSGWAAQGGFNAADGAHGWGGITNVPAYAGISGIQHDSKTMFVTGVFFSSTLDTSTSASPAKVNYTTADTVATFSPLRRQQVFIGNGLTTNGMTQTFVVPAGADRLALGFAENFQFQNPSNLPGFYGDNGGTVSLTATLTTVTNSALGVTSKSLFLAGSVPQAPLMQIVQSSTSFDLYSFTAAYSSQRIGIDVDLPADSTLDPYVRLFDSNGIQLAANDNATAPGELTGKEAYLSYSNFQTGGTYYVGVSSSGNSAYNPLTGLGDIAGSSKGSYYLIVSPGITGTLTSDVGLGTQTFVVDILQGDEGLIPIDAAPNKETWIVTHGRVSSRDSAPTPSTPGTANIAGLIREVRSEREPLSAQVLSLDWSGAAAADGNNLREEDWIIPVAGWAWSALADIGIKRGQLNLIGHSWGANVSDELALNAGGVNTIIAIDPAQNGPRLLYPDLTTFWGGVYDPDSRVNFAAHSQYSWSFFSRDGGPFSVIGLDPLVTLGNPLTAATADESFVVTNSEHSKLVNLVLSLLQTTSASDTVNFSLSRLLAYTPGPWKPNQFTSLAVNPIIHAGQTPFEGVIVADSTGMAPAGGVSFTPLTFASDTVVNNSTLYLDHSLTLNSLTIGSAGRVVLMQGISLLLRTGFFTLSPGGVLDVGDNALIIDNPPATDLRGSLQAAYNSGTWTGAGITSTTAAANPNHSIAYAEASDLLALSGPQTNTWHGQTVDATSLLLTYTKTGDTNLDGVLDANDQRRAIEDLSTGGTTYTHGDFNYDGQATPADYALLNAALNAPAPMGTPRGTSLSFPSPPPNTAIAGQRLSAISVSTTGKSKLTLSILAGPNAGKKLATARPKNNRVDFSNLTLKTAGTYTLQITDDAGSVLTFVLTVQPKNLFSTKLAKFQ